MFEAELVDSAGEPRVGEARLRDERGKLPVGGALWGSFRHLLSGLLPSGPGAGLKERRECSRPSGPFRRLRPTFIRSCEYWRQY
ncbi:hypothetical protein GCM10023329_10270 [Streptomyces sanyensis]|uniref:Uncharacterized protein n=1 Tax=Streptomyces sanyensis TaxID=568869 RepID=A0ABP8ZUB6_9ACTN